MGFHTAFRIGIIVLAVNLLISPVAANQQRFKGVQITVGVQNVSAIGGPAKEHAKTWEQRTGWQGCDRRVPLP